MSGKFVRASKYRHVFGQAAKKELSYENLKITKNAWDSNIIATNGEYLSVNWNASGGGSFAVIPLLEVGKAPDTVPLFRGHKGPVLDTCFDPFNAKRLASCSDDGKICIWQIPEDYSFHNYLDENEEVRDVTQPIQVLSGHTRKVGHVEYHPCAQNVLASCSMDYSVKIWNLETGKCEVTLQHDDLVTSFAFNYSGSLLATTSRDKKLYIWDVRSGKVISTGPGHTGAKPSRVIWAGNTDRIITTGFSRLSDRQVGVWDVKNIDKGPIDGFMVIDASSGVLIPVFDEATSMLYLAGKGDGNIRYYELENDYLHELSQYASTDPQRGFAVTPKRAVNVKENEIMRSFKTVNDSTIEPILFIVPRRSELFQEDIYPDCPSHEPALTASEWFKGKQVNGPLLMSMSALYEGTEPAVRESDPEIKISEIKKKAQTEKAQGEKAKLANDTKKVADTSATRPALGFAQQPPKSVHEMLDSSKEVNSLLDKVIDRSDDEKFDDAESGDDAWEKSSRATNPTSKSLDKSVLSTPPTSVLANHKNDAKPQSQTVKTEEKVVKHVAEQEKKNDSASRIKSQSPPAESNNTRAPSKKPENEVKSVSPSPSPATPGVADQESSHTNTGKAPTALPAKLNGPPTLTALVEKLSGVVVTLEGHISELKAMNANKDERLLALETKINTLLGSK